MIKPEKSEDFKMIQEERFKFESRKVVTIFFLRAIAYSLFLCGGIIILFGEDIKIGLFSFIVFSVLGSFLLYVKGFIDDVEYEYIDDIN